MPQRDLEALTALVDDLFLLARIEGGQLDLIREPLDLTELIDEAVEALQPAAAARRVSIQSGSEGRAPVVGNATAIGRIIRNLLDNAVHHAPLGSTVRIAVAHDGPRRQPQVRVVDDGPGFPIDSRRTPSNDSPEPIPAARPCLGSD